MHFHQHGYVSADPRIEAAAGYGIDRPADLPDEVDVLIVGSGPAGMVAAAQLSQYPGVNTRLIEKRDSRLVIGQADGIQARSVETFQAFGFAEEIIREGYHIIDMSFWNPDPENPEHIIRTGRPKDDETGISEFPHLIVNQARVLDYFAQFAKQSPGRIEPDYGIEFVDLTIDEDSASKHPVSVTVRYTTGERAGEERTIRAGYVVGCDGARSGVRKSIGRTMTGDQANHAWGVMDVLANSDFPDIRNKCAISSKHGNILHIPREGGHLFRMYVDLGEVPEDDARKVRQTSVDEIIDRANAIIKPYSIDVKNVAWHSVYEVGHRLTDAFDDTDDTTPGSPCPRVFITGDACHTHSAKAGQGMNVSMQDGFNISWKLGQVLSGRSSQELLRTYSAERQVTAKNLIDFDKEWSTLMATPQEELPDETYLQDFYVKTAEFPAGFMTEYTESMITASTAHQELATGFPWANGSSRPGFSATATPTTSTSAIGRGQTAAGASMSSPMLRHRLMPPRQRSPSWPTGSMPTRPRRWSSTAVQARTSTVSSSSASSTNRVTPSSPSRMCRRSSARTSASSTLSMWRRSTQLSTVRTSSRSAASAVTALWSWSVPISTSRASSLGCP